MNSERRSELGLLVLRLPLGLIFLLHGWMKLTGAQLSFVQEMLIMVGVSLPAALIWLVAALEAVCGVALLTGFFARPAAWALAVEMIVVAVLFHVQQGFFIVAVPNAPLAYGFEYHIALLGGLLCIALSGPGLLALRGRLGNVEGAASGS